MLTRPIRQPPACGAGTGRIPARWAEATGCSICCAPPAPKQVPLALLDLKYPAFLSALDFIGGLDLVQRMEQEGLLITPEFLPDLGQVEGNTAQLLNGLSDALQQVGSEFGLPPSPIRYTQPDYFSASTEFPVLFADLTRNTTQPGPLNRFRLHAGRTSELFQSSASPGRKTRPRSMGRPWKPGRRSAGRLWLRLDPVVKRLSWFWAGICRRAPGVLLLRRRPHYIT